MAEPFSIVSGALGIAAAFAACVNCFEYIRLGRRFGRDFQTSQLALDCARLRLSRWGEAVHVYDDPHLGNPNATPDELEHAKTSLLQILDLFQETATIARKYRLNPRPGDDLAEFSAGDLEPASAALHNKMRELAIRRQKGASLLKTAKWALYHGADFDRLIGHITSLIGNLEALFPAPQQQAASLVADEIAQVRDQQQLKLLAASARHVDERLGKAADEAVSGHLFRHVQANSEARVINGNIILDDSLLRGAGRQSHHTYDRVVAEDRARVHNGDQYGGRGFWD